eukprot:gnl/Trimastix_PCT/1949.p1 GENE.gnl/Trimastix_PCT/1949~~gnl/Trimastix_PCT/1949.p1  ORF type:complete len:442 (+),score=122.06 gnl/Trimastix_PCT/1949:844-2169(+)
MDLDEELRPRPARLGLGAKFVPHSKAALDLPQAKLKRKILPQKKADDAEFQADGPRAKDDSDEEEMGRSARFARKATLAPAGAPSATKKGKARGKRKGATKPQASPDAPEVSPSRPAEPSASPVVEVAAPPPAAQKRRTKTRSKQKNIRRDNRPDAVKEAIQRKRQAEADDAGGGNAPRTPRSRCGEKPSSAKRPRASPERRVDTPLASPQTSDDDHAPASRYGGSSRGGRGGRGRGASRGGGGGRGASRGGGRGGGRGRGRGPVGREACQPGPIRNLEHCDLWSLGRSEWQSGRGRFILGSEPPKPGAKPESSGEIQFYKTPQDEEKQRKREEACLHTRCIRATRAFEQRDKLNSDTRFRVCVSRPGYAPMPHLFFDDRGWAAKLRAHADTPEQVERKRRLLEAKAVGREVLLPEDTPPTPPRLTESESDEESALEIQYQ